MNVYVSEVAAVRILSWAIVLCFLSAYLRVEAMADEEPIVPAKHQEILMILEKAEASSAKGESLKGLREYPKAQQLQALAYALQEDRHASSALQAVLDYKDLEDQRLVPYLAKVIQTSQGHKLYQAVVVADRIPNSALLPVLIDHALDSDYVQRCSNAGVGGHHEFYYSSVFAKAASAIYKITDGKIGSEDVPTNRPLPNDERKALIKKWRQTWSQLKQEKSK